MTNHTKGEPGERKLPAHTDTLSVHHIHGTRKILISDDTGGAIIENEKKALRLLELGFKIRLGGGI